VQVFYVRSAKPHGEGILRVEEGVLDVSIAFIHDD
jgi:hypothetical protein